MHGRPPRPARRARPPAGRLPHHPQRGRRGHRRRDPLADRQPAGAGHPQRRPHPPHRLRHGDHHRGLPARPGDGGRPAPGVGGGGLPRRRPGRAAVDAAGAHLAVPAAHRRRARLRLRRAHRSAARGRPRLTAVPAGPAAFRTDIARKHGRKPRTTDIVRAVVHRRVTRIGNGGKNAG
ncbi:hypothetical protein SGPA1_31234 [Streptomyces misionensis JCM 4497]